jgi:XTP/dITP diphosphohydrolase
LTQLFWDRLQADRFSEIFGKAHETRVIARTIVAYCDGQRVYYFNGEMTGKISPEPRGPLEFQWDCVFIPDGFSQTFAEMGEKKSKVSMRKRALDSFAEFLKGLGL